MITMAKLIDELERVYGTFADDAIDAWVMELAAQRLGALPASLRLLYARTGFRTDLHRSVDELVMPLELAVRDGFVSFCVEQQAVCEWAIAATDLSAEDPAVYTLQTVGAKVEAVPDFGSITEFVALHTVWQASNGGLPFFGFRHAPHGDALVWSGVAARLGDVGDELVSSQHGKVSIVGQAIVGVNPDNGWCGMGARTQEALTAAMESVGLRAEDWSMMGPVIDL